MESRLVLVLHPDAATRQELCALVQPLPTAAASTREEALALLARAHPSFVILPHALARRVLRDVERHAPDAERLVLCPDEAEARFALLEVAEGHEFTTLALSELARLPEALKLRGSPRVAPARPLTVRFELGRAQFAGSLLELGSDGLSLSLTGELPIEALQPGTSLGDLAVLDAAGAAVLEPRAWLVRSVSHLEGLTRIGALALRDEPRSVSPPAAADPIRVGALVYRAVRRGARFLLRALPGDAATAFDGGAPDAAYESLRLRGRASRFARNQIVELSFELSGRVYSGATVVTGLDASGLAVAMPRVLRLAHRRKSLRLEPREARLRFVDPLTGAARVKELCSLHPTGAAFHFDGTAEVYPPGLVLQGATVELHGRALPAQLVVQSTARLAGESGLRRCGLKLQVPSLETRQLLLDALISARQPEVVDGSAVDFDALWELFSASAVHFPDYAAPGPALDAIRQARARVGDGRSGLSKSLVWKSESGVQGHCGGLRVYSRSWFTQHLVVRPGYRRSAHVSEQLVNLMVDYAEALEDVDYLSAYWRADNRFMVRVCGAVGRKLAGSGMVSVHEFVRLRRALPPPLAPGPAAHDADAAELEALLQHLRTHFDPLWLRSKDLVSGQLELDALAGRYGRAGLLRRRLVGAAGAGSRQLRGWALLEEMTPGLFWAELYNGFRLVLAEPQAPDADAVRLELLRWVGEKLRQRDRQVAECLATPDEVPLLERLGFTNLGGAIDFTLHRQMGRQWSEELLAMFERVSSGPRQPHGEPAP